MLYRLLPLLLAAVALGGCNYNPPYVDEETRNPPKPADLVGTYSLSDETLVHSAALVDGDPYKPGTVLKAQDGSKASVHQLMLRSDGTFSAVNIPLWKGGFAEGWTIKSFQSGVGTWSITGSKSDDWSYSFIPSNFKLIPNDNRTRIDLLGHNPPYTILFFYGAEPDDDSAMLFTKEK
ncbi:hypothetical protein IAD21_01270 [Abditibacteriota bacterium]|nr:hypothetical protein IAD21_01270 [Abditibacteriota bacterium]